MHYTLMRRGLLVVILLALPSVATAQVPQADPVQSIGSFFSNLFQVHGSQFSELASNGKHEEAAELWAREKPFFDSRADQYRDVIFTVAKGLNEKFEAALTGPVSRVRTMDPTQWPVHATDQTSIQATLARYDEIALLKNEQLRSPAILNAKTALNDLDVKLQEFAADAFAAYDHLAGRSFFAEYPARLPSSFLQSNFERLKPKLSTADKPQLARFIKTYHSAFGDAEHDFLASLYIGTQDSLSRVVGSLAEVAGLGLRLPRNNSLRLIRVLPSSADDTFPVLVRSEFPLPTESSVARELTPLMLDGEGFLLLLHLRDLSIERRITSRNQVGSRFVAGHDTVPNPDYEQARLRYLQAEAQHQQTEFNNAINRPVNAFAAILQGVASGIAAAAKQKAFAEFSAISPTMSVPRYSAYQVETATVNVRKQATVVLSVIDLSKKLITEASHQLIEERQFALAYGLREDDPERSALMAQYQTEKDVETFERKNEPILLTALTDKLDGSEAVTTLPSFDRLVTAIDYLPTKTSDARATSDVAVAVDDPRFSSVVVVTAGTSGGAGFFIASNLVITNNHVVEGAGFAEIRLRDGRELYGKVVKRDPDADLALIRVTADVPALKLSDLSLKPGQTVEAIGHPRGFSYSLTRGIISAIRKRSVPGLRVVVLVQTDAAINPGNSGGPLLDGDKVVGINTMRFKGAEGIGFAVHAQEIRRFIAD